MTFPADETEAGRPDLATVLADVGQAAYVWDIVSDRLGWSANAAGLLAGVDPARLATGRGYASLLDPANMSNRYDAVMQSSLKDGGVGVAYGLEYALSPAGSGGPSVWVEDCGRWHAGPDGRPACARGVIRIVDERHARDQDMAFRSRFDPLTGEMNRARLGEVVGESLENAQRFRTSFAFLLAAIDNLAVINTAYGFDLADDVIAAVAKRLRTRMRGADTIGRFSGNKFGLVLQSCTADDLDSAAQRFIEAMKADVIHTSAGPVAVTISLGAVVAPRHARTVPEIFARAHEALDAAKLKRRGSFVAFMPSVERETLRRENARLTDEIVGALNQRRVSLAYQPIVAATSRAHAFDEALMRVRAGDGSMLDGGQVVPVAERLGLVRLIDHRVLELALAHMAADPSARLSVNVSPSSILDREWSDLLQAGTRRMPELARRLIVEITESAAIRDIEETRRFVTRIRDLGCRVAIDDFGAGYTSFRNLRDLGVDMVKIDGGFVARMLLSADDRKFVTTLLDLARHMGMETVAEWVEDETTARLLVDLGCDYLQGSHLGAAAERAPAPTAAAG